MRARCGAPTSRAGRSATSPRRSARTRRCTPAGTAQRSNAACTSLPRRSRPDSSPARARMRTSTSPSRSSMRRSPQRVPVSFLLLAAAACARPQPLAPGAEPELRVGVVAGVGSLALGGDGELFLTDDATGGPIGSIPPSAHWTVVADSAGLRLVQPDGSQSGPHRGISAVNVTENQFAMADGRRYRGRLNVVRDASGLTLMNRVPVEAYLAGVIGEELGPRRPDERQAMLAQAVVSRTFALKNRGRWEPQGFDAWADIRDQVYRGVAAETPAVWEALRATAGEVLQYRGELIDAYFHSTCGFRTASLEEAFKTASSRPYLRPVSDERSGGYYCDISPRFRWREEGDATKLRAIFSRTLPAGKEGGGGRLPRVTRAGGSRTGSSGPGSELAI